MTDCYSPACLSRGRMSAPIARSGARGRGATSGPQHLSTAVKRAGEARAAAALSADHAPQAPTAHSAAMGLPPAPPRGACLCSRCKGRLHWGPKAWSSQGFLEGDPFLTGLQRTAFPGGANGSSLLHLADPPAPH